MNNSTIYQGLDVAWKGLTGIFLVLILFYGLIKLMLAAGNRKSK